MSIVSDCPKRVGYQTSEVSSHQQNNSGRWRTRAWLLGRLVVGITPLVLMLLGCSATPLDGQDGWTIYRNPRYNFEFPYPTNWESFPMPDNRDGRAFRDSNQPSAEIRGWAANKLSAIDLPSYHSSLKNSSPPQLQNFTTQQGFTGQLQVEVGAKTSLMTMTLSQGKVQYYWQGQCDSKLFANYFRLFYYIASQYRLSPPEDKAETEQ